MDFDRIQGIRQRIEDDFGIVIDQSPALDKILGEAATHAARPLAPKNWELTKLIFRTVPLFPNNGTTLKDFYRSFSSESRLLSHELSDRYFSPALCAVLYFLLAIEAHVSNSIELCAKTVFDDSSQQEIWYPGIRVVSPARAKNLDPYLEVLKLSGKMMPIVHDRLGLARFSEDDVRVSYTL